MDAGVVVRSGTGSNGALIICSSGQSGLEPIASGNTSLAWGHAGGDEDGGDSDNATPTQATGQGSIAMGRYVLSSGKNSFATGVKTKATGDNSHAEGSYTTASGECSHAEGILASAIAIYSHAEGESSLASGTSSHAEGGITIASGAHSHAEGHKTTASGGKSHAEGNYTTAYNDFMHVQGQYNDITNATDGDTLVDVVGWGSSSTDRKNIETTDQSGNKWVAGKMSQEGTPTADNDLVTKAYMDQAIAAAIALALA